MNIKKFLTSTIIGSLVMMMSVGAALADHSIVEVEEDVNTCSPTTISASVPGGTNVTNMYLTVDTEDDDEQFANIPSDGSSVDINVGPFSENTTVYWNVFGGGERNYDLPHWDGYGTDSFASDINAYASDVGTFNWVIAGTDDPNPFVNWNEVEVDGCDQEAPVVEITSPTDGETVNGLVDIVGSITDDVELSHYNLSLYPGSTDLSDGGTHSGDRLNDSNWCTTPTSGTVNTSSDVSGDLCDDWDTTQYADGEYQIRLAARDAAGNRDASDPENGGTSSVHVISITINNIVDTKDQCKDGGWMDLVDDEGNSFKNQGQCVSYVASDGKSRNNPGKGNK